jgi:hypothetical protein
MHLSRDQKNSKKNSTTRPSRCPDGGLDLGPFKDRSERAKSRTARRSLGADRGAVQGHLGGMTRSMILPVNETLRSNAARQAVAVVRPES